LSCIHPTHRHIIILIIIFVCSTRQQWSARWIVLRVKLYILFWLRWYTIHDFVLSNSVVYTCIVKYLKEKNFYYNTTTSLFFYFSRTSHKLYIMCSAIIYYMAEKYCVYVLFRLQPPPPPHMAAVCIFYEFVCRTSRRRLHTRVSRVFCLLFVCLLYYHHDN